MPHLSKHQRTEMVNKLIKNRKYALSVTFAGEAGHIPSYAHELAEALREGGWEVAGPSRADCLPPKPGVIVWIDGFSTPNPCARLLVDVLTAVGIKTKLVQATPVGAAHCCLVVAGSDAAPKAKSA